MMKKLIRDLLPQLAVNLLRNFRNTAAGRVVAPPVIDRKTSLDFEGIYKNNGFGDAESRSGGGSTLEQTCVIRREIPLLLRKLGVRHFLDVPCGDLNWMRHVDFGDVKYTGGDVVQAIVDSNRAAYGDADHFFERINIVTGPLTVADLIFCRDCLVHLNYFDGLSALEQFRSSGAKWFLATTFVDRTSNAELCPEGAIWRPLNLELAPYNLPPPEHYINEKCTEGGGLYGDKCLGLWRLSDAS